MVQIFLRGVITLSENCQLPFTVSLFIILMYPAQLTAHMHGRVVVVNDRLQLSDKIRTDFYNKWNYWIMQVTHFFSLWL